MVRLWLNTAVGSAPPTTPFAPPARRDTGPFKVLYNIRLEPDLNTLSGANRVDFFDTKGKESFSFSGKAACTRVQVGEFDDLP